MRVVPAARWLLVLAVAVGLAGAPVLVRAWPVAESDVGAVTLAERMRAADAIGWSGEVRTQGAVEVPLSDSDFDGVARLLGESSQLRVWWRSAQEYRVDRVRPSGETDVVRDGGMTVRWRYEGNRVSFSPYTALRLPDDPDVVPVSLAGRMLSGATAEELERLPSERIAGRAAAGLRLTPSDPRSTLSRVDLWADAESGLPLRVEVYAGGPAPVLSSEVERLDLEMPTTAQTDLDIGSGVDFSRGVSLDEGSTASDSAYRPVAALAGLPRRDIADPVDPGRDAELGANAVYGRGPTAVAALPVRDSVARGLAEQLGKIRASRFGRDRISVELGPLSVVLTRTAERAFLLVGTVTAPTLARASDDLVAAVDRQVP